MPSNPNIPKNNEDDEEAEILNERFENFGRRGKLVNEIVEEQNKAEQQEQGEPAQNEQQPQPEQPAQPEAAPAQPETQNINELSVDQLLNLDVTKLSRDELIYMQAKLKDEYQALETSIKEREASQTPDSQVEAGPSVESEAESEGDKALEDYARKINSVPRPDKITVEDLLEALPDSEDSENPENDSDSEDAASPEDNPDSTSDGSEDVSRPEQQRVERATARYINQKNKPKSKKIFSKIFAGLGITALLTLAGAAFMQSAQAEKPLNNPKENEEPDKNKYEYEQQGIIDGYNEKGMWASENKPNDVAFASAVELGEIHQNNPVEMTKDVADKQVESFGDYMSSIPDPVKDRYGMSNWDDMNILDTVKELEGCSDARYETVKTGFNHIMDQAQYRDITLNGEYDNAYMTLKDPNGPLTHENMELVKCTTIENGTKAIEMFWTDDDGNEIGSMIVKIARGENGDVVGGCVQVVNKIGSKAYDGMKEIEHDKGDPSQPSTPDKPDDEWGKEGDPNSGPNRDPSDQVDPNSEVSKDENDNTNKDNQGYKDDNGAKPGSGSESSGTGEDGFAGSGTKTDGADTDGGRLSGGENQGGDSTAGENSKAPSGDSARDDAGNASQGEAQRNSSPGANNNSNSAEEKAVESRNF